MMTRTIVISAIVLALLAAGHGLLRRQYEQENPRYSRLHSLVDDKTITEEDVKTVGVVFPGSGLELIYARVDDTWRMPQYRGAYARADLVNSIVRDITATRGIEIDTEDRPDSYYGFSSQSITIKIYATDTEPVGGIVCGGIVPGFQSTDSYVKILGEDDIYHINGNPLSKFGAPDGLPPLVDSQIIPNALAAKGELAKIYFEPQTKGRMLWIERREKPEDELQDSPMRRMMPDYKEYNWFAMLPDGREIKLNERSAGEYTGFVRRLAFDRLPRISELDETALKASEKRLVLEFEAREKPGPAGGGTSQPDGDAGQQDIFREALEIRESDSTGKRYIYYSGTELIASVEQKKIGLLFPSLETLKKKPAEPSIYRTSPPAPPGAPAFFSAQ